MNRTQEDRAAGGRGVAIRRAHAKDVAALGEFFAGLSATARYRRFFAAITPTAAMLRVLSGGGDGIEAVVATWGGAIIGHAMAADRAGAGGTSITEVGVVVGDAWQGRGVGSDLIRVLITGARERGVATVVMDVMPGNQQALSMIKGRWPAARMDHSGDCITVRAGIAPFPDGPPRRLSLVDLPEAGASSPIVVK